MTSSNTRLMFHEIFLKFWIHRDTPSLIQNCLQTATNLAVSIKLDLRSYPLIREPNTREPKLTRV